MPGLVRVRVAAAAWNGLMRAANTGACNRFPPGFTFTRVIRLFCLLGAVEALSLPPLSCLFLSFWERLIPPDMSTTENKELAI